MHLEPGPFIKNLGKCAGCGKSTKTGDHSQCHLLIKNTRPYQTEAAKKQAKKSYLSGKHLPNFMYT